MKTKLSQLVLIIGVLLASSTVGSAHFIIDPPVLKILKKLDTYVKTNPAEKVHIHLDKPYYAAGENIWFKAYVLNTQTATSSNLSQILYVDLLNEQGHLFKQARVALTKGLGWADFVLPDSLEEGNYRIRAYTNWMKNVGNEFYFDKVLKIGSSWANALNITTSLNADANDKIVDVTLQFQLKDGNPVSEQRFSYEILEAEKTISSQTGKTDESGKALINLKDIDFKNGLPKSLLISSIIDQKKTSKYIPLIPNLNQIDLQFFPEGGNFVNGIPNRVAFKAINIFGRGMATEGKIIDNEGNEVAEFKSNALGMGSVYLLPQANKSYKAVLGNDNDTASFDLPQATSNGYTLHVNNESAAKISVKVDFSPALIRQDSLSLILHQDGYIAYSSQISMQKSSALLSLPKADLPSGVYTLTLFNPQEIAVAERILFVHSELDKIKIESMNLNKSYQKRGEMDLVFKGQTLDSQILSNYSVSVTHTASVTPDEENETHILTSLLLKGDLKGYIENPNRYFFNTDIQTIRDLDHLMLTQGWRKINWEQVITENYPQPTYSSQASLPISGTVTNLYSKPLAKMKVSIFNPAAGFQPLDALTDENGRFSFDNFIYLDSVSFFVNAVRRNNATDLIIKIDSLKVFDPPKFSHLNDYSLNVNEDLKSYLAANDAYFAEIQKQGNLNGIINLKAIEIKGKKPIKDESFYKSFHGIRRPDIVIDAKELGYTNDVKNAILARYNPSAALFATTSGSSGGLLYVVDGMISDFIPDIQQIALIEIIKPISSFTALYGSRGGNGVVLITTRNGSDSVGKATNFVQFNPPGLSIAREFYSPKYTMASNTAGKDLRKTVYWNPNVLSDKDGRFGFNYFNTDEPGTYRMVIEGISETGQLARQVFTYEVN